MLNVKKLRRLYESACRDDEAAGITGEARGQKFFDEIKEGLENKTIKPSEFSIRGLMEEFITDLNGEPVGRKIVDSWNPRHGGGEGESLTRLMEGGAVMASGFSNITGQIVYNAALEEYQNAEFEFTDLIPVVDTMFNGERIPGIGDIGDKAEIVGEAQQYPMVGTTEDWIDTPQTTKRGLILPLTKEAAFFDRTGILLERCGKVGMALGINKEKRAVDCVIDENTTTHRYNRKSRGAVATYGANSGTHDWNNSISSNALLNWIQVDNVDQLLYTILDPNTGEPIVITGKIRLIVSRGLLRTAQYIKRATSLVMVNPGFATSANPVETMALNIAPEFEIMTSRMLATRQSVTTSWYYGCPEKAFCYMQNWPLTVVQAPQNSEVEFNQDIAMRWKASERGQYTTKDPRYMAKSLV